VCVIVTRRQRFVVKQGAIRTAIARGDEVIRRERKRLQIASWGAWRAVFGARRMAVRRSYVAAARALAFWINYAVYRAALEDADRRGMLLWCQRTMGRALATWWSATLKPRRERQRVELLVVAFANEKAQAVRSPEHALFVRRERRTQARFQGFTLTAELSCLHGTDELVDSLLTSQRVFSSLDSCDLLLQRFCISLATFGLLRTPFRCAGFTLSPSHASTRSTLVAQRTRRRLRVSQAAAGAGYRRRASSPGGA
jgi:hypothetical protein